MKSKLKVKFFYDVDITRVEQEINKFSETVDVHNVQFQWTQQGNSHLTQNVLTAMVLYFEVDDFDFLTESEEAVMRNHEREDSDTVDFETVRKELGISNDSLNKFQQTNAENKERLSTHDK